MSQAIQISEQLYSLLEAAARKLRVSASALAEQLIRDGIVPEDPDWQSGIERLLDEVHQRVAGRTPEEIEADITAAAQEAKAERRAHHRPR